MLLIRTLKNKNLGVLSESPKDSDPQEQEPSCTVRITLRFGLSSKKPWCPVRITLGFGLSKTKTLVYCPNHLKIRTLKSKKPWCTVRITLRFGLSSKKPWCPVRITLGFGLSKTKTLVYCPNHQRIRTLKSKNLGVMSESPKDSDSQEQEPWCTVRITLGFGLSKTKTLVYCPNHLKIRTLKSKKPWCPVRITLGFGLSKTKTLVYCPNHLKIRTLKSKKPWCTVRITLRFGLPRSVTFVYCLNNLRIRTPEGIILQVLSESTLELDQKCRFLQLLSE